MFEDKGKGAFDKAAATDSLPGFFSHAAKGGGLDDILGGELGGLGGDDGELEVVDEVEHLNTDEDFEAALKATVGGDATGLSYGQMLEEPDDGGFDFESMLQESTSVLGGLGLLDAPLSDLQDLQDTPEEAKIAQPQSRGPPANAWALPGGSNVLKGKVGQAQETGKGKGKGKTAASTGATTTAAAAVVVAGKGSGSSNNKGKSLLSALQFPAASASAQPSPAPEQQQQQHQQQKTGNAWAQGPPPGMANPNGPPNQAPPGMMPPPMMGSNGLPMHPGLMDPRLLAANGLPPMPPGFMMGPRGPMPIPGGPPPGMMPPHMMGPGGPGGPPPMGGMPFMPLPPGAPLPPGFPPNFHELPPDVKANIHQQYHQHMMMLGANAPPGMHGQPHGQQGYPSQAPVAASAPTHPAAASAPAVTAGSADPTPAELAQMEKDGVDTRQGPAARSATGASTNTSRPGQPTVAGGRGGRGGRGPSRANKPGAAATTNANANTADANTNTANANSKSAERDANTNGEEKTRRVKRTYPRGQMMSSSDVKFVTDKVMTPLKFQDPYSQDFYYLQNGLKQNAKLREKAIKESTPMPAMIMVPQPLWRDFKDRIRNSLATSKENLSDKAKKWEEREQVLGHMQRTNVSQPRELLSVPTLADAAKDGEDITAPFASTLWAMRAQVQRGYEALSTVKELNTLLRSSNVAADPFARSEILYEVDRAVANLASSVGVLVQDGGWDGPSGPPGAGASATSSKEVMLDGGLVAALLQSAKGKKLMSRSMNLLAPEHRWALLPAIAARILQTDPKSQSTEDTEVEARLLKTMLQFIQHSQQFQEAQQQQASADSQAHPFSLELLGNLKKCIKGVMVAHMEKQALRGALLSSRHRALLLNTVVTVGDKVRTEVLDATESGSSSQREGVVQATDEWVQIREAFMGMLDSASQ